MDSISDNSLSLEFGEPVDDDLLELGILDTEAQALSSGLERGDLNPQALYRRESTPTTHFGAELSEAIPHVTVKLPHATKSILGIALGGVAGGFLIGGPIGATAGAVIGYLMA